MKRDVGSRDGNYSGCYGYRGAANKSGGGGFFVFFCCCWFFFGLLFFLLSSVFCFLSFVFCLLSSDAFARSWKRGRIVSYGRVRSTMVPLCMYVGMYCSDKEQGAVPTTPHHTRRFRHVFFSACVCCDLIS